MAFQDPSLLPWLNLENVAFGLDFARQPHLDAATRQARVDQAIAAVGLEHARARYPAQLSGGMAQRTALAAAWHGSRRCCCSTNLSARWTK